VCKQHFYSCTHTTNEMKPLKKKKEEKEKETEEVSRNKSTHTITISIQHVRKTQLKKRHHAGGKPQGPKSFLEKEGDKKTSKRKRKQN